MEKDTDSAEGMFTVIATHIDKAPDTVTETHMDKNYQGLGLGGLTPLEQCTTTAAMFRPLDHVSHVPTFVPATTSAMFRPRDHISQVPTPRLRQPCSDPATTSAMFRPRQPSSDPATTSAMFRPRDHVSQVPTPRWRGRNMADVVAGSEHGWRSRGVGTWPTSVRPCDHVSHVPTPRPRQPCSDPRPRQPCSDPATTWSLNLYYEFVWR